MTADYPDWALAEKVATQRAAEERLRELALGDMWFRLFTAFAKNARHTNATALRYDARLSAGMAQLDAEWERISAATTVAAREGVR